MNIILLVIIGAAAGFVATKVMKVEIGLLPTVSIGILGALVGGLIVRAIGSLMGFGLGIIGAIIGAMAILWIWSRIKGGDS